MAIQIESEITQRWPNATTRINALDDDELEFWSQRLRVSREMLRRAVWTVGERYLDVERYLYQKRSVFTRS